MGKASSGKKVARAASTGGGRTSRGKTPWGWYSAISVVVILGIVILVMSRNETQERVGARAEERPTTDDHWHTAYGFYFCDQFLGQLSDNGRDPKGVHTHGDGIIHVHPFSHAASGKRAILDVFFETMGVDVTQESVKYPGRTVRNGDKCGDKEGEVTVWVNGERYEGDPGRIHFEDRQQIVWAFAPKGTEIPKTPSSAPTLDNLSDVPGSPGATSSTSQVPNAGTATSAPSPTAPPPGETSTTASSTP